jgi:predicted GNAT superfamily acetyltransferase
MNNVSIRNAEPSDYETICALNLAEVRYTSPMDTVRLSVLSSLSCYFKLACVAGGGAAFLLAIPSGAAYENDNFSWFARRHPRFVYIDRVIVSDSFRGMGLGSQLYADLFRFARDNDFPLVTCEYNISPPNEPSRFFHDKFGFTERGTQWVDNGSKQVSLQAVEIPPSTLKC